VTQLEIANLKDTRRSLWLKLWLKLVAEACGWSCGWSLWLKLWLKLVAEAVAEACGWSCGWGWGCTVLSCRGREVRGLHAALATQGQTQMGKEKGKESCQPFSPHVHTTSQALLNCACPLFLFQLPELPLQLLVVSLLSSQPRLKQGFENRARGFAMARKFLS